VGLPNKTQWVLWACAPVSHPGSVTDHALSLSHVIDWDHVKVINRESNRMDQRWIREVIHIRKEQEKSYDYLLSTAATSGGQSFRRKHQ